jgi:hypothetical protein
VKIKAFKVICFAGILGSNAGAIAQPKPGEVFREFAFLPDYATVISDYPAAFSELDPGSKWRQDSTTWTSRHQIGVQRHVDLDLQHAVHAELSAEIWGGHIGTAEQKFRVNDSQWLYLPQPAGTPTRAECYYRTILGNTPVAVPLQVLKNGRNAFEFAAGPQVCHNFDFGFYWVYAFIVRVYYDNSIPHPAGVISNPVAGSTLGSSPQFTARITAEPVPIKQVDFIGFYEDFDWEGNGVFRQWHYQTNFGRMVKHLGTSRANPYEVTWNNFWVPDQDEAMQVMARIMDENGLCYMTPAVAGLKLDRKEYRVRMFKPRDVPENFGVRIGQKKSCFIDVNDVVGAREVRLLVSTWSGKTDDGAPHQILLNGQLISDNFGRFHNYSYDYLSIPLTLVRKGANEVAIYSEYRDHALEVNWPGPVLLIKYDK